MKYWLVITVLCCVLSEPALSKEDRCLMDVVKSALRPLFGHSPQSLGVNQLALSSEILGDLQRSKAFARAVQGSELGPVLNLEALPEVIRFSDRFSDLRAAVQRGDQTQARALIREIETLSEPQRLAQAAYDPASLSLSRNPNNNPFTQRANEIADQVFDPQFEDRLLSLPVVRRIESSESFPNSNLPRQFYRIKMDDGTRVFAASTIDAGTVTRKEILVVGKDAKGKWTLQGFEETFDPKTGVLRRERSSSCKQCHFTGPGGNLISSDHRRENIERAMRQGQTSFRPEELGIEQMPRPISEFERGNLARRYPSEPNPTSSSEYLNSVRRRQEQLNQVRRAVGPNSERLPWLQNYRLIDAVMNEQILQNPTRATSDIINDLYGQGTWRRLSRTDRQDVENRVQQIRNLLQNSPTR